MLYLLYIFVGLLIIFGVNLMITGLLAVHDMYTRRDDEEPTFDTFKKYFAKKLPERVQVFYLPSTSPANARLRLEGLAERWRVILQFLT